MPFAHIDTAGIARALDHVADRPTDQADVYLERKEIVELPPEDETPGLRVWREMGLAVRLVRDNETWIASRDRIDTETFHQALRRVVRATPQTPYRRPELRMLPWRDAADAEEVLAFPGLVRRALRTRGVRVGHRLTVQRHRRWVKVVGPQLAGALAREHFYALRVQLPWRAGDWGLLTPQLDDDAAERAAQAIAVAHAARDALPPQAGSNRPIVLAPAATAVLLHETVAHALEVDTLALGGHPEAAIGVRLGGDDLHVCDDPTSAPENVRRATDDEGFPAFRRWLLRKGVVEQPLCDAHWARRADRLVAGAARRGGRHDAPAPRSTHLELMPGEYAPADLLAEADGGLYLHEIARGQLDPLTGAFQLVFAHGRRITGGHIGDPVGPCRLQGHVADLLGAIVGIGREVHAAGAGWCAKDGLRVPVWATAPALRLEGLRVAEA